MLEKVTVTYDGSAFYPETHLNLEPNTRYTIHIISQEKQTETTEKNAWDLLEDMAGTYEAQEDWSSEHDHYLYGTTKRNS
ncbi:hypothetical protein J0895_03680 [Phormidium pseudopriestleyi FRX01]|uniref:DUF104 domain-containing protein n=2 Tax=Phormidium TaxID=1198 RepID=A0ABS3FN05_9CYAN|nr:hypothetical protein [Phormidium pseudopriestleyi FRX01]